MLKGTSNVEHEFFPPPILPSLSVSMYLYSGFYVTRSHFIYPLKILVTMKIFSGLILCHIGQWHEHNKFRSNHLINFSWNCLVIKFNLSNKFITCFLLTLLREGCLKNGYIRIISFNLSEERKKEAKEICHSICYLTSF